MSIKVPSNEQEIGAIQSAYFRRFNLSFSISNSKKHGQKGKIGEEYMRRNSGNITPNNIGSIQFVTPSKINFHTQSHTQNKSVNLPKKAKQQGCFTTERADQIKQAQYIARPFPKRRQKSGQHQLIKLLLKYSNNLTGRSTHNEERSHRSPMLYDPEPARQIFKPNLKNKTKMNWVKDRYCANRDKDYGLIDEGQGYNNKNKTSYENSWLIKSSFQPKKIA